VACLGRVEGLASQEGDVYGMYTAMSPTGVDYNTMLTDTILGQLPKRKNYQEAQKRVRQRGKKDRPRFCWNVTAQTLSMQLLNNRPAEKSVC
jgi:hypothetical protein